MSEGAGRPAALHRLNGQLVLPVNLVEELLDGRFLGLEIRMAQRFGAVEAQVHQVRSIRRHGDGDVDLYHRVQQRDIDIGIKR